MTSTRRTTTGRATGGGPGPRRAVMPAVALLAGAVLLAGCQRTEVDGIGSYTGDEEFPPQRDLESFEGCADRQLGWVEATGAVVNRSPTTASYRIIVGYESAGTRVEEKGVWLRELGPGEQRAFDVSVWLPDGPTVTDCAVLTINRWNAAEAEG